jgi:hypothetical protein
VALVQVELLATILSWIVRKLKKNISAGLFDQIFRSLKNKISATKILNKGFVDSEFWAVQAYGAACTWQEMLLTVKCDNRNGRRDCNFQYDIFLRNG